MKKILLTSLCLLFISSYVHAKDFFAGAASRSIMPAKEMVNNSIHSNMTVRFDELGSPVNAKALALTFGDKSIVLIALDISGVKNSHSDHMRKAIAASIGLEPDEIVLSASHSHSTPFLEPMDGPHPYFDFVLKQSVEAVKEAWKLRRPARFGHDIINVVGASFNTRVPMPDGGVKFTRDFREGLASGRPIDPRLSIIRFDDENGKPIAGWVRFATHPACVIFNTPISGEYPGYMTERLSKTVAGGAPVLFGYGASGDSNCIPMFGSESDSRNLGRQLADLAAPVFEQIQTKIPRRLLSGNRTVNLPLDPPPSIETLDKEIDEINTFIKALDTKPELEWVMGINCKKEWPVKNKINHVKPLAEWAELMKQALKSGRKFPSTWPSEITALIIDDMGMVFYPGEPFTELGFALSTQSPLEETLLMGMSNGANGYIGTDVDRLRGGYETYSSVRYSKLKEGVRPLPYALGSGEFLIGNCISLIDELCGK